MKTIILVLCAAMAVTALAENYNPPAVPVDCWVSNGPVWCPVVSVRKEQLAGEVAIQPLSNSVQWTLNNSFVISYTNAVPVTNTLAWSAWVPAGILAMVDFRGGTVEGIWLRADSGVSNLVKVTWFGR